MIFNQDITELHKTIKELKLPERYKNIKLLFPEIKVIFIE